MKKKLISMFFSVATTLLVFPMGTMPKVSAEIIQEVSRNDVPDESLDERIDEFKSFLNISIRNGFNFSVGEIRQICAEVTKIIKEESALLKVDTDTIIVGDTHSDIGAVNYCCRKFLEEVKNGKSIVFLGDYVDRGTDAPGGPNGIKNIMLLYKLKVMFPDRVVLLRGNHEDKMTCSEYGFFEECMYKYSRNGLKIFDTINDTFEYLSLAAIVKDMTFCVHGGIPSNLNSVGQISALRKPISSDACYDNSMIGELLWNDPSTEVYNYMESPRGNSIQMYGKYAVRRFHRNNGLIRTVRAHQCIPNGHEDHFKYDHVITLFSAPNYCGLGNTAFIMEIGKNDSISYEKINYSPEILRQYPPRLDINVDEFFD